jgi:hypothetical protein
MPRNKNLDGDRGAKVRVASIEARTARADARAACLAPVIAELQASGVRSLRGIAAALNGRGVRTFAGKEKWQASQVRNLLARLRKEARERRSRPRWEAPWRAFEAGPCNPLCAGGRAGGASRVLCWRVMVERPLGVLAGGAIAAWVG